MEKGGVKILVAILVILVIVAGGVLAYKIVKEKEEAEPVANENETLVAEVEEEKTVQIFKGNDRPFAVMIDNHVYGI